MTQITDFNAGVAAFHHTNLVTSFGVFFSFPCVHQYLSFSAVGNTLGMLDSAPFRWHHLPERRYIAQLYPGRACL